MATILVVEDDILLSLDTSDALKDAGYDVIAAANADEAIKVLETRNDIRTIFTDINMPGSMDGLKLAAAVRDRWPPVHIIVTSGMRAAKLLLGQCPLRLIQRPCHAKAAIVETDCRRTSRTAKSGSQRCRLTIPCASADKTAVAVRVLNPR